MKNNMKVSNQGSVLITALCVIAVLAVIAGGVFTAIMPRYHATFQTASWQESRLATEGGIDMAIAMLYKNAAKNPISSESNWTGWKTFVDIHNPDSGLADLDMATLNPLAYENSQTVISGNDLKESGYLVLNDVDVSPEVTGIHAEVDVKIQALYHEDPNETGSNVWYRIQAIGTSQLPNLRRGNMEKVDAQLRKLNLHNVRQSVVDESIIENGKPNTLTASNNTATTPSTTRIVEVIVKSISTAGAAILTSGPMKLAHSNNWELKSYRSPNRRYQETYESDNADIVSLEPSDNYNTPAIYGNGADVDGDVGTKDRDNPATTALENVSGTEGMDVSRINDDTDMEMPETVDPFQKYATATMTTVPANTETFVAGPTGVDTVVVVDGDLGPFVVERPVGTTDPSDTGHDLVGRLIIIVKGDVDTGSGGGSVVNIADGVEVEMYVAGNIAFGNGDINRQSTDSQRPCDFRIWGYGDAPKTFETHGNPDAALVFEGPNYDVEFKGGGNGTFWGAITAKSFAISGGGKSAFYYDEDLNEDSTLKGFEIVSYYENSRL